VSVIFQSITELPMVADPKKCKLYAQQLISFLLVNIWVNLLWLKISRKRKGSRLIYRTLFILKQMLTFLSQAIERKYQVVEGIYLPSG